MTKTVARLFDTFQPTHYELTLHPDKSAMTFTGSVTITGKKTGRPSKRITLHQNGLKITEATIVKHDKNGDKPYKIARINNHGSFQEVRLHADELLYPGSYTVIVEFSGVITRGMSGLYPCFFNYEGVEHTLLATQFESHHAREVFPCIDEPEAKATFDLTVSHEKNLVALGNNPVKETKDSVMRAGFTETTFETSPKMSTYLLAFVIGELHSVSGKTKSGVAVNIWGTIAQPKESFTFALEAAIGCIEFFEDYFHTPYPLPKADHVALPDFSSGAMENWGLITYREAVLLLYPDAISQSTKETIALVVAHETSHQWFGNLVTMKWWDDLWLNESFANMMEYEAVDALYPDWNIWDSFITAEGLSAYRRDSTYGVQAVKTTVNHPDEISTLFDPSIVYAKGGRLLYMLKNFVGESAFRTGLQEYFQKHAYSNTTGTDLWEAIGDASKLDIADFMNPWLERSGYPVISIRQTGADITIRQQHFLDDAAKADTNRIWPVPLFASNSDVERVLDTKGLQQTLSDTSWVTLNTGAKGHYIVRYETDEHKNELTRQIEAKEMSTIDRLTLLSTSSMLARAGYDSFGDTLKLLQAFNKETEEPVWDIMALILADTRRFMDIDESLEAPIKKLIRSLITTEYKRLGWEELATDSAADQKLRGTILGLGAYAEHPEIVQHALDLYDAYKSDPNVVSAELRGIIFSVAVKSAHPHAITELLEVYAATNSSDLQRDITGAVTSTKSVDEAETLLGLATDASKVKPQDADRWLFYLLRNRYARDFAWQWMEDNWRWIEDTYKKDKSYDYFPRYAASVCSTPEQLTRYRAFFEPKSNDPMLTRNIAIGLSEIESRVQWLQRDITAVKKFFTAQ